MSNPSFHADDSQPRSERPVRSLPDISVINGDIIAARTGKNVVNPWQPYAYLVEKERSRAGTIDDVMTIFLTNRECPFHCTMCDLWKNTLDERVPIGAIPAQLDFAFERLPTATSIKLYNAGNFFDSQAIPVEDHPQIAARLHNFDTVIIENHPRLTDDRCLSFRDQLNAKLEVAMGLETTHPQILAALNKHMTVDDFDLAARFLKQNGIDLRVFLLVKPPWMSESNGRDWALKSIEHAVNFGADCISLIPTRPGSGFMEKLQTAGDFSPPSIHSMETVLERGLEYVRAVSPKTRVLMDVWNAELFFDCAICGPLRAARIQRMNLSQKIEPRISCHCVPGDGLNFSRKH